MPMKRNQSLLRALARNDSECKCNDNGGTIECSLEERGIEAVRKIEDDDSVIVGGAADNGIASANSKG